MFNLKIKKMKKLIALTLMLVIAVACFSQEGKWKKVLKKNTIENYQKFLEKYPTSKYSDDARLNLVELEFNNAKVTNTITTYKYFLDTYNENSYTFEATENLIKLEFEHAESKNTIDGYNYFLDTYKESFFVDQVTNSLIELEFEYAKSKNTIEGYKYFLDTYQENAYAEQVTASLIDLEFKQAKSRNTIDGYKYFANTYPDNKYLSEISDIIAGIDFEQARKENTIASYNNYLSKFPNNKFSILARSEIAIMEYENLKDKNSEKQEIIKLCTKLESLGEQLDTLATTEKEPKDAATCYAKAAELFELSGDLKKGINQNNTTQYKKSGYYYNRAATMCMAAEFKSMSNSLNSWINNLDKGGSKSVEVLKYNLASAVAIDDLKKNLMYNKSVSIFREAGFEKHADWMMDSGNIKGFKYEAIIE